MQTATMYSYETKDKLFDIVKINGQELVRINSGQWSNRIDKWHRIHYAIKNHFNI